MTAQDTKALLELAHAYDREDAAQRGEPDPWPAEGTPPTNEDVAWAEERVACARAGMEAFRRVSPSQGEGPAADVVEAAKAVIADWDHRLPDGPESFKTNEELGFSYWSPAASMVSSEPMSRLRAAIASLAPRDAQRAPADEQSGEASHVAVSDAMVEEISAICTELGCQEKPGVALRFVKELRRDLSRAHERQVELLRTWEDASLTERQELDRLRRGWGPSTPTERMARRTDLRAAMTVIERAMDAVLPDDKKDEDMTREHFQAAHDKLSEGYREIIALMQAIPELSAPDATAALAAEPGEEPAADVVEAAHLLLSEIDAGNDADEIRGATGPLRDALASLAPRAAQGAPADERSGETSHVAVSDAMVEAAQNELGHFGIYASTPTVRAALTAAIGAGRQLSALAQPLPLKEEVERVLYWYAEQTRLCRLIYSEGDAGRNALAKDGGNRARALLSRIRAGAQEGWRDIASAPKDASSILYINKFGEIGYCYWSEAGSPFDQSMWWDDLADDECCPVGWLPADTLPAAPSPEAKGGPRP